MTWFTTSLIIAFFGHVAFSAPVAKDNVESNLSAERVDEILDAAHAQPPMEKQELEKCKSCLFRCTAEGSYLRCPNDVSCIPCYKGVVDREKARITEELKELTEEGETMMKEDAETDEKREKRDLSKVSRQKRSVFIIFRTMF